ncbi:MAG: YggS family pyridoxal phosphate-dependent enzyme [Bacteroidota bacterium]
MYFDQNSLVKILSELKQHDATLVAVSKTKPVETIKAVYNSGHHIFGENYVQELVEKASVLPQDIQWHFIGHLQSNKVKLIAPFVSLVQGVDSFALLKEIDKQAKKNSRVIDCLLQVHIAQEETKFGLSFAEAAALLSNPDFHELKNICVKGLMGMATLTGDRNEIRKEFNALSEYYQQLRDRAFRPQRLNGKHPPLLFPASEEIKVNVQPKPPLYSDSNRDSNFKPEILSMGMSSDYKIALLEGSNMVRIGSLIFGDR